MISIIIPVYKVESYLDRCVKSVVDQSYSNIEIILVDDGSPDHCPEMCDEWAKKDSRIKVIHKSNSGLSDARNVGIRQAIGEYVLFVDSDDYIANDTCLKFAEYADDVDMVVGESRIYENNKIIDMVHTNLIENHIYSGEEYAVLAINKGEWFAPICFNLYRRDLLINRDLYFKSGILHEDIEFMPRLCLEVHTLKYLHYEFYQYCKRNDSITANLGSKQLDDLFGIYSSWKQMNDQIINKKTKKAYCGALSKYFMFTCRTYKISKNYFPNGINRRYLIFHSLNMRELIKACLFSVLRSVYVRL
jgi:glycosyltransferase involved in cell wall biosynthesis